MIKIAIAEDIVKLAETLVNKIELLPNFKIVFVANNGEDLLKNLQKNSNIDIIFMDINMPIMNGILATEKVSNKYPHIKIIILSIHDDEDNIFNAILAGAMGYLLKDDKPDAIHKAIYEVLEGGVSMSPEIARKSLMLIKNGRGNTKLNIDYRLTARETEILTHLSKGLQYDEIANNLNISKGTVRKHIENIYKKLHVNNKVEAVQKFNS